MDNKKQKLNLKEIGTKFIPTIKKIFIYLKKAEFNKKMKLIGEVLVIIILLCLLKLPFSIVRDLIINAFFSVEIANKLLMNMIYIIFELPYLILVIYIFMKMIVTKYENIEVKEEVKLSKIEDVSLPNEIPLPKIEEVKSETKDVMLKQEESTQIKQDNEEENELPSLVSNNITESVPNNKNNSNS